MKTLIELRRPVQFFGARLLSWAAILLCVSLICAFLNTTTDLAKTLAASCALAVLCSILFALSFTKDYPSKLIEYLQYTGFRRWDFLVLRIIVPIPLIAASFLILLPSAISAKCIVASLILYPSVFYLFSAAALFLFTKSKERTISWPHAKKYGFIQGACSALVLREVVKTRAVTIAGELFCLLLTLVLLLFIPPEVALYSGMVLSFMGCLVDSLDLEEGPHNLDIRNYYRLRGLRLGSAMATYACFFAVLVGSTGLAFSWFEGGFVLSRAFFVFAILAACWFSGLSLSRFALRGIESRGYISPLRMLLVLVLGLAGTVPMALIGACQYVSSRRQEKDSC